MASAKPILFSDEPLIRPALTRRVTLLAAACVAAACLVQPAPGGGAARAPRVGGGGDGRPNIVFVLTDDFSLDLLQFVPHVQAMARQGLSFSNYFVSDSLCCPSRSSIFTGEFPHDTGVFGNFGPHGGFRAFYRHGDERHTFAVALQRAGYLTALMGKYLNGYMQTHAGIADGARTEVPRTYVPPGWSEWDVAGWGYPEFNYTLNENGVLHRFGHRRSDYLTDVLAERGVDFITRAARRHRPFFLELSVFAPHSPYRPAPRNANDFPGLTAPRPPSFDAMPSHAPRWLAAHGPLTPTQIRRINEDFRRRAQAVEAVDRLLAMVEHALAEHGLSGDTYVVFSSDNGLHTGEYRLMPGKLTAFDTDIHVPLIVTGPGVPAGATTAAMAENTDLAETFAAIGGTSLPGDGQSLLGALSGQPGAGGRNAVLVEHRGSRLSVLDPDFQQPASGSPTTYEAMRTRTFLYVEYADGERELYDLRADPFELHNLAWRLTPRERALLHDELRSMARCHGEQECSHAMHVQPAALTP